MFRAMSSQPDRTLPETHKKKPGAKTAGQRKALEMTTRENAQNQVVGGRLLPPKGSHILVDCHGFRITPKPSFYPTIMGTNFLDDEVRLRALPGSLADVYLEILRRADRIYLCIADSVPPCREAAVPGRAFVDLPSFQSAAKAGQTIVWDILPQARIGWRLWHLRQVGAKAPVEVTDHYGTYPVHLGDAE